MNVALYPIYCAESHIHPFRTGARLRSASTFVEM